MLRVESFPCCSSFGTYTICNAIAKYNILRFTHRITQSLIVMFPFAQFRVTKNHESHYISACFLSNLADCYRGVDFITLILLLFWVLDDNCYLN